MATPPPQPDQPTRLGPAALLVIAAGYTAALAAATWPFARTFGRQLPGGYCDALTHLWTMRWYRRCLVEGISPFVCDGIQYPVGAHIGTFPPMHAQSVLYFVLSNFLDDVASYDAIWLVMFLGTGLATAWLATRACGDRACGAIAGLAAMLSTPMLMHGQGHLELIAVGGFPLFLGAWLAWLDRPTTGRALASAATYLLMATGAPYFFLMGAFPAALAAGWGLWTAGRGGRLAWIKPRLPGFALFAAIAGVGVGVLFAGQIRAVIDGVPMERPRTMFDLYGAPWWSYLVPTAGGAWGRILPTDVYATTGYGFRQVECASYLGVVTLGLLAVGAIVGTGLPRARLWWAMLGLMVVMSMGANVEVFGVKVPMPAGWLRDAFFPMRFVRVPARFNLFAVVVAAVIAASTLRRLLDRLPGGASVRSAALIAVAALIVVDLGQSPFLTTTPPAEPAVYAALVAASPPGQPPAFLDAPAYRVICPFAQAACGYWQSNHHGRTTAGYSANANAAQEALLGHGSPFADDLLMDPAYLADPAAPRSFDIVADVRFADYTWLYMTTHRLDYLVMHRWVMPPTWVAPRRAEAILAAAQVADDGLASAFALAKLPPPTAPALVCADGWLDRGWRGDRNSRGLASGGRLAAYRPPSSPPLVFAFEAASVGRPRLARLLAGDRELARWTIAPTTYARYESPPLDLPAGLSDLRLAADDTGVPPGRSALRVAEVRLDEAPAIIANRGNSDYLHNPKIVDPTP